MAVANDHPVTHLHQMFEDEDHQNLCVALLQGKIRERLKATVIKCLITSVRGHKSRKLLVLDLGQSQAC